MNTPTIYLVGFGPGNPDLLTIKADRLLRETQIIFYDNLIDETTLEIYPARKVYVGKRKGRHSKHQTEINEILYKASLEYTHIVRLKGGDPLIFGRVGEEIDYLRSKGIHIEIVPGISSASASAAACGVSLTQRGISSSVAYCTGHPLQHMTIPTADTLVFFMGASTLQEIMHALVTQHRSLQTPVAIVRNASLPTQHISQHTIESIIQSKYVAQSPSIVIVGDVLINP
ncbi:MAG TPA: uroporphyrinogen-III C-methyltransferase [Bacteroidales bacterium]|nr:MAG: Uroporphyrinogen-III C-methyltransferase [Bacteroidetes bacterium ADurb.Bin217]HPM12327.1 uroporphyrinogen-III C-methyltransferase [Bacteroidales bacterium]